MSPSIDVLPLTPRDLISKNAILSGATEIATHETTGGSKDKARQDVKTVDGLVRYRARASPDATIVAYPSTGIDYVNYTASQLDAFAYRVGKYYQQFIPCRRSSKDKPGVIGLLGLSNLEYIVTLLALVKLGHTILFLSTRISPDAVASLMTETKASYLITDLRFSGTAGRLGTAIPRVQTIEIASRNMFEFPVETTGDTRLDQGLDPDIEASYDCWIIHSSGRFHGGGRHVHSLHY